jgi:dimethylargininase
LCAVHADPSRLIALVRKPGLELERCALTFRRREPIDVARAREQHAGYVAALERLGVEVQSLPRLPQAPDATFVEDAAVVLDELAVLGRAAPAHRRGELASVRAALAPHRPLLELAAPATLDGGDVLVCEEVVFVGQSRRTNHLALKTMAHALLDHGYMVKAVEMRAALHLKTAATYLGDDRLLAHRAWLPAGRLQGLEIVEAHPDEPFGANVLRLGETVLVSQSFPRTAETLDRLGYQVEALELGELEKAEAGITCLGLLFPRRDAAR